MLRNGPGGYDQLPALKILSGGVATALVACSGVAGAALLKTAQPKLGRWDLLGIASVLGIVLAGALLIYFCLVQCFLRLRRTHAYALSKSLYLLRPFPPW
jgi:hypothetical protein